MRTGHGTFYVLAGGGPTRRYYMPAGVLDLGKRTEDREKSTKIINCVVKNNCEMDALATIKSHQFLHALSTCMAAGYLSGLASKVKGQDKLTILTAAASLNDGRNLQNCTLTPYSAGAPPVHQPHSPHNPARDSSLLPPLLLVLSQAK